MATETGGGRATAASRSKVVLPVKFFTSQLCPHSQRVWFALEEKAVDYQLVEIDLYRAGNTEGSPESSHGSQRNRWLRPLPELRGLYPDFIATSPKGRLPALDNEGERIFDSLVLMEYIHEVFPGTPLLPTAPYQRAQARLWAKHVDMNIVPHFDRLLLGAHDAETRAQVRADLIRGLAEFEAAMAPESEGPFFLGDDFSIADIALAPWWQRMCSVLRAYRKFDPFSCPRLVTWFDAVKIRAAFQKTMVDPEQLIQEFSDCADPEESSKFRRAPGATLKGRRPVLIGSA